MQVLLDARVGRKLSGIGQYVMHLCHEFGELAPGVVRPATEPWHVRRLRRYGLRPLIVLPRRPLRMERVPDADVVHGPNFHAPVHPRARGVSTFHDLGYLRFPDLHPPGMSERLDGLIRASLAHTEVVICDSQSAKDDFVETYPVDEARCRVVHLGLDRRWLETAPVAKVGEVRGKHGLAKPYLLHVGALIPRKDVLTLCEAFREIAGDDADLELVLAGNPTKRWATDWHRLQEWIAAHPEVGGRVRTLDYVSGADLPALYAGSEACVSTTLWEGFGLTVLEGLASRRPVVSSDVSSVPEIGGEHVHYGHPKDPSSYAAAIRSALGARGDAAALDAGRAHAATFTWRTAAESTLAIYREAAAA